MCLIKKNFWAVSTYCIYVHSDIPGLYHDYPIKRYRGPDAVNHFVKTILEIERKLQSILIHTYIPIIITPDGEQQFRTGTRCYYCGKGFDQVNANGNPDIPVRDHCHLTGKYRGVAHESCKKNDFIPVIFHNFWSYDSYLICKSVGCSINAHQIKVIVETFE